MKNSEINRINRNFDFTANEKISIFVGAYGSGKSEVAVNFALMLSERMQRQSLGKFDRVVLADLDTINPYFRSLDAKDVLHQYGVNVISPRYANTNVDVPAVPGEIFSVFDQPTLRAVLDIGGEDLGARVVSSLKNRIATVPYAVYMVVNQNRPFTGTKEEIIAMMNELEEATGLATSGIINNTNLLSSSNIQDLTDANAVLAEVSGETGIPLCFASGMDSDYPAAWGNETPDHIPFLRLARTISYDEPIVY